ncbi:geranylgeranyl reductase [Roseibium hamelinense]|uniref:Geranylgeranyl diphosphate reductase n=1 Tax=Roseibium hamelinense TaxID=150831 RepID=A0A562SX99_9HYPH|nr:geranylgeranyl diphosphate reductase [Roseibium hamelinense]MTI44871.1 geranylgeranyl diphosphate reductase [Roseibium hamelinense]TWI85935.1 geranylgeranyl reductase [Roseibium hamelinense]
MTKTDFDVIVIGGGPAGATAAERLACSGTKVLLVDKEGRIKPCGGAIPSIAMRDFDIAASQIKARVKRARMTGPSGNQVGMEIGDIGYVGMVDREEFDPYLRERAALAGADRLKATFKSLTYNQDGTVTINLAGDHDSETLTTKLVIGADGANSQVRKTVFGPKKKPPYVFAYHEIVESPQDSDPASFEPARCEVIYDRKVSPDFYGWVFPHGGQTSIGVGSAVKGHDLKDATKLLRDRFKLSDVKTVRCEGAPLPLKPMRRWDNRKNVVLIGDAAGVVAPSSGEGIYYAMHTGDLAAQEAKAFLETGSARHLGAIRKRFMKGHGRVFFVLGLLQYFWYGSDKRREQFVNMCKDPDIQRLTWESYLNKKLVRKDPMAHIRVAIKDMGQLLGLAGR